ncbi:hypothetical protein AZA_11331 [Nitrospirillum viridazoti Y2]|nr:hypothetical protein AZA_11331 [Nitrospirillum amazonense Y2]
MNAIGRGDRIGDLPGGHLAGGIEQSVAEVDAAGEVIFLTVRHFPAGSQPMHAGGSGDRFAGADFGNGGPGSSLIGRDHVDQRDCALILILGYALVVEGDERILVGLSGGGIGCLLRLDRADQRRAHFGDVILLAKFDAALDVQFLADHLIEDFPPLRGRGVVEPHALCRPQIGDVVAHEDRHLIDHRDILGRYAGDAGALRGEQAGAGHDQSGDRSNRAQYDRSPLRMTGQRIIVGCGRIHERSHCAGFVGGWSEAV